jgi:hypothetical protein
MALALLASGCAHESTNPPNPPPSPPSLTLVNQVVNDNGGAAAIGDWTVSADGPTPVSGPGGAASGVTFAPGTYTLSATGPAGYRASAWSCAGGGSQSGNTITLAPRDTAICIISHDDTPPRLTLVKAVTNDNGGTALPSDFELFAQGPTSFSGPGAATSDFDFRQGPYTLREGTGPGGYTPGTWTCTGGVVSGDPAQITLTLGQVATCTVTNDDVAATHTTYYVDNPGDFLITTDVAPAGLSAGDIVTFSPSGGVQTQVAGLTFGTTTFATIQDAINAVTTAYDVINVAGGTFAEQVTINKSVVLRGNQYGVDARQRAGTAGETVLTGSAGSTSFTVTAGDVTIDGFTIQDATNAANAGAGVVIGYLTSGTNLRNNIIKDNISGVYVANFNNAPWTVIQQNVFRNNNRPGPTKGVGVYADTTTSGQTSHYSILIDNNSFLDDSTAAIELIPTLMQNVTISNNLFDRNGSTLVASKLEFSRFTGNESRNSALGGGGAELRVLNGVVGLVITHNILTVISGKAGARAIWVSGPSQNIQLAVNSITAYDSAGVVIESGGYTGTFDAKSNWWGSAAGPDGFCNLAGLGGGGQRIVVPNPSVNLIVECKPFLTSGVDSDPGTPGLQP